MNEGMRANQDGWFDDEPAGARGEVRKDRRISKKTEFLNLMKNGLVQEGFSVRDCHH